MNALETKISDALAKRGWPVIRRGWPDFLIYREGQAGQYRVAAVEVKSDSDHLSEQQEEMHRVLRAVGLPVHVLRPDFVNKRRMGGKTCAVLTASEKLDVEQQVSSLK